MWAMQAGGGYKENRFVLEILEVKEYLVKANDGLCGLRPHR